MLLNDGTNSRGLARQIFATFSMSLVQFSTAVANSIVGVFTDQATSDPGKLQLTFQQISWISSSLYIGNMAGYLLSARLLPRLGAGRLLRLGLPPLLAGWLATALAGQFAVLVAGRLLTGAVLGLLSSAVHTYVSEVASAAVRGTLGSAVMAFSTAGILATFVAGCFLRWQTICLVLGAGSVVLAFITAILLPSSPKWLITRGRTEEEAQTALRFFHGDQFDVAQEIADIRASLDKDHIRDKSLKETVHRLGRHWRPLLLVLANFTLFAVSGGVATTLFAPVLLRGAGLPPYQGAALVGAARLVCVLLSGLLVDRLERRSLLLANAVLGGLGCALATVGFWRPGLLLGAGGSEAGRQWLCVGALLAVVGAMSVGLQPLAGVLMAELLPNAVRAEASGLALLYFGALNFATVYAVPWAALTLGLPVLYAFFGAMHALLAVFAAAVPRTRGRSLEEIQAAMDGRPTAAGDGAEAAAEKWQTAVPDGSKEHESPRETGKSSDSLEGRLRGANGLV